MKIYAILPILILWVLVISALMTPAQGQQKLHRMEPRVINPALLFCGENTKTLQTAGICMESQHRAYSAWWDMWDKQLMSNNGADMAWWKNTNIRCYQIMDDSPFPDLRETLKCVDEAFMLKFGGESL